MDDFGLSIEDAFGAFLAQLAKGAEAFGQPKERLMAVRRG